MTQKSDENFKAIDLLIDNGIKTPVIHCAYYGCFQLLIYYTYEFSGLTEEEALKNIRNKGSHNYFLSVYVKEIRKLNSRNASKFYKFFTKFKRKRTEADYYKTEILESDVASAKKDAIKIREFLKEVSDEGKCENIFNK